MNTVELNQYIENYLKNDKTNSAIMLTGAWGSGKSYYIKNNLCPFLVKNKLNYAIISLYGLCDIKELNKNIYVEFRTRKLKESKLIKKASKKNGKEIGATIACAGNTIVKGVASFFNVGLELSDKDIERLFSSIDLTNKLIILEDVERSGIDIIEILGYINNLVENDGAKVLLVCNEAMIAKYDVKTDDKGNKTIIPKESTKKYLEIKEKTIGDTLQYIPEYKESIESIYKQFDNPYFLNILQHPSSKLTVFEKTEQIMQQLKNYNLRSLIYALQRTEDVVNKFEDKNFDLEFVENMLLGTVAFCVRGNQNKNVSWDDFSFTSFELGTTAFPMFKLMFDYIKYQQFNLKNAKHMEKIFLKAKECSVQDENLRIIYNYYIQSEKNVKDAIDKLHIALQSNTGVQYSEFLRIANYLIAIKSVIKDYKKIDECLDLMVSIVEQAAKNGEDIDNAIISGIEYEDEKGAKEFIAFQNRIKNAAITNSAYLLDFDYTPDGLVSFYDNFNKTKLHYINKNSFAGKLNIEKFVEMISKCNAEQIQMVRRIFRDIYGFANINEFFKSDLENLQKLREQIQLLREKSSEFDSIQKQQLSWFDNNLKEIIEKLSD